MHEDGSILKPNLHLHTGTFDQKYSTTKKQHSSSSLFLTQGNNTGPKLQWSTENACSKYEMHETSLLSTPDQFGSVLLP